MARGSLSSVRLTLAYLRRIKAIDPKINAVRTPARRPSGRRRPATSGTASAARGPLDGIPVLLKDNVDTRDMPTTAGSLARAGKPPRADAELVAKLRAGGAVIPRAVPRSVVDQSAAPDAVHRKAEGRPHTGCTGTFRQRREAP
ncbi:amidase family protein [Streptomyces sp. DT24]|uniref:amidase family protein n=1 Tax=Streptomyces sp. DT24 TaxID=3416520 RepID=UPI003CF08F68